MLCAIAVGSSIYLDLKPALRMDWVHLFDGLLASLLAILFVGLSHLILLIIFGKTYRQLLEGEAVQLSKYSSNQKIGFALVTSAGEELCFRSIFFSWALTISPVLAYGLNGLIALLINLQRNPKILRIIPEIVAATFYASAYQAQKSYFLIFIAHFICVVFWDTTMRTEVFVKSLEKISRTRDSIFNRPASMKKA
jgi:hypothetical protein